MFVIKSVNRNIKQLCSLLWIEQSDSSYCVCVGGGRGMIVGVLLEEDYNCRDTMCISI